MEKEESKSFNQYLNNIPIIDYAFKRTESFVISHKSFLEIILEKIKKYQYFFLSEKINPKKTKQCLLAFKNNLLFMLKEKTNKQQYLEKEINIKKSKLQHKLYDKNTKNDQLNNYNGIDNMNYIKEQLKLKNNKINYLNEKKLLETLSFKAENEINKIESDIQIKINSILILRTFRFRQKASIEIIPDQKQLISKADQIMKKQLKNCRHDLLIGIKKKINTNLKANKIKEEIKSYKKKIQMKENYITSEDIINEDPSDRSNSLVINHKKSSHENLIKEEDNENKNKISNNRIIRCSRNTVDHLNIDNNLNINNNNDLNEFKEVINKKIIRSLSNKIKRINFRHLKENYNLNINFNFNVNNLNILNGNYIKIDNNNKNNNLTYMDKSFNKENYNKNRDNMFAKN